MPLAGTPAIADKDMGQYMEYLIQQQPIPSDAIGVPVALTIFDPNNNTYTIGTTTSDVTGKFAYAFTPQVPGLYKITATFAGSNSYGPSFATTCITVASTPPTAPTAQPLLPVDNTMTIVSATVAIIVAIALVGVFLALLIRKRHKSE
jgi:hypothetical protein